MHPNGNGTVDTNGARLTSVATPVNSTDGVNKAYVDAAVSGLHVHAACNVATTGDLATSTGGTITYNNGTAGVGATLTLSGSPTKNFTALGTFDTGFTATAGDRVLVKSQSTALQNGILSLIHI